MGACGSNLTLEEKQALDQSRKIDDRNRNDYDKDLDVIKLLLLGAGESGKSTIFKQMKILYGEGFSQEERNSFRRYIWGNIIEAIKAICEAAQAFGEAASVTEQESFDVVMKTQVNEDLTPELAQHILRLWADPTIKSVWARRANYQVIDTTQEFFKHLTEIASPTYMPTDQHMLLSRVRTTGIVEEKYLIKKNHYIMFDVGGQRNERKKWIHCFDGVNAVIFVTAVSEFDQNLFEDESMNRMVESLNLFDEVCNSRWFSRTSLILFLNKRDLFEEKIARVDVSSIEPFADFSKDPRSSVDTIEYFLSKFLALNKNHNRDIYHHVTTATDTTNIGFVMNACTEIILKQNLEENGFVN